MIVILLFTVIGQCGFWVYQWKTHTCTEQRLPKFKLTQHSKVISPAVSAFYELVSTMR